MVKKLLVIFLFFNCYFTYAQTIKTDVLVIGNGASAVTAAMQCAKSKVKTILLIKGGGLENMQGQTMAVVDANRNLPSGTWGEFRKEIHNFYKKTPGYDTAYNAPLKFEPYTGASILKKMADTTKNLTIKLNSPFTAVKKDGTGWEVSITQNGKTETIKAKVIIDATANGEAVLKAGAKFPPELRYTDDLYRTAIVSGISLKSGDDGLKKTYPPAPAYCLPISALIAQDAENLFIADKNLGIAENLENLPMQMAVGQGTGTMAAFCAFFKTTQKDFKVRLIQGELLDFKGYILPFEDVNPTDRYFRAIQQIGATGLLKGIRKVKNNEDQFFFMPDSAVNTAEVKPVLTEIYSRAFLWFNKVKPAAHFTVGNTLAFICEITLSEPKLFQTTIQKEWKTKYKFASDFDMNRPITRRELAILANQFLNPFARAVDLNGRIVN